MSSKMHLAKVKGRGKMVVLPEGGHLLMGHHQEVRRTVSEFLNERVKQAIVSK